MTKPIRAPTALSAENWRAYAAEQRQRFIHDPHRPRYHFLPPANWTNDPNGVIEWEGRFHLFYQYNPNGPFWGTIHWGHAVSDDLVFWEDLPVALSPTPGGPDADGCFSGCAVDDGGVPTLVYTGEAGGRQTQCLATSTDGLLTWTKDPGNPVLASSPAGVRPLDFRDPFVWREDGIWYMVLASGQVEGGGVVLLYRSSDLREWEYLYPLLTGEVETTGEVWECPNFFPLGDRHVLIVSVWPKHSVHYFVGDFVNGRFTPETHGVLDPDGSLYAPLTLQDSRGRRLMWGWLDETGGRGTSAGWAGVISLPRVLSLDAQGGLKLEFAPELQKLRSRHLISDNLAVHSVEVIEGVKGRSLEIRLNAQRGSARRTGLSLCRSPGGEEETLVYVDWETEQLVIDARRASLSAEGEGIQTGRVGALEDAVDLHLYLDGSVLEVVADGRLALNARVYPSRDDSLSVQLVAQGGRCVVSLDVWQLGAIW